MSLLTPWGYALTAEELPGILTPAEFSEITGGKFRDDGRIAESIKAATAAVRNYCGWHLYPSMACEIYADSVNTGRVVQLPSRHVTSVEAVTIAGRTLEPSEYVLKPAGLLILKRRCMAWDWGDITVHYTAGLPDGMADAIKDIVADRAAHALSGSYGVQSEAAGGLSVTYNAAWIKEARATALPEAYRDTLDPYRVQGVY